MLLDVFCVGRMCQVTGTFYTSPNAMCLSNLSYNNNINRQRVATNNATIRVLASFVRERNRPVCICQHTDLTALANVMKFLLHENVVIIRTIRSNILKAQNLAKEYILMLNVSHKVHKVNVIFCALG
jgi:hypothetical protein